MVTDATGTITIKVGTAPTPEIPWWLIGLAGGLGIVTVVVVRSGEGKGKKKRRH